MGSLRKAKLAINVIRNLGSKISTRSCRNPVLEANNYQLKQQCVSVNSPSRSNISRVSWYSPKKFNSFHTFGRQTHKGRPFLSRSYHSSRAHALNLIPPGLRRILLRVLVGGVVITIWGLERIPYSGRFHVILLSEDLTREIGENTFNGKMKTYEGKILPETHPESVRVKSIANDIIKALEKGLKNEKLGSGLGYNGFKAATYHLEGLDWEIFVVNEPTVRASVCYSGKIFVSTGLFDVLRTDAEIATAIAHEVGHVVARHGAEDISKKLWLIILKNMVKRWIFDIGDEITKPIFEAYDFLLLPFRRRNEMEADYIGLLLLASAGYDPQVAPQVYEKLGKVSGDSPLDDYLATHPSGKKRAKALSQAKVMAEALGIYNESRSNILLEMMRMSVI
ncbi:hypothetical protein MKW94_021367 [Papaver nudicaule]|uniref:Peptidase M48 domain-containing protein n=1 Tax=Papaver nudicaule TaxID=74823 RepID=A0AA41V973_PAPNU|nr:hypothetical protein [Papaver nudicaule]